MTTPDDPGSSPSGGPRGPSRARRNFPLLFVLLGLVMIALLMMNNTQGSIKKVDNVGQIDQWLDDEIVATITVLDGQRVKGTFRDVESNPFKGTFDGFELSYVGPPDNNVLTRDRQEAWMRKLHDTKGEFKTEQSGAGPLGSLLAFLPWLLLILLFWWLMFRQMRNMGGGGVMQFGRSRARMQYGSRSVRTDRQYRRRRLAIRQAFHNRNIDALADHRIEEPIRLFVASNRPNGQRLQSKTRAWHNGATRSSRDS